jgi:hypothetical protein
MKVRQSFRAAFVESAIEAITNQPRLPLEDLGEIQAEIGRSVEANASRPIGTCPKCQRRSRR